MIEIAILALGAAGILAKKIIFNDPEPPLVEHPPLALPAPEPKQPTAKEKALRKLELKREIAKALIKEVGLSSRDVNLQSELEEYVKDAVRDIFHHPDHQ